MIIHGDCLQVLEICKKNRVIFADIPDNIGLAYEGFNDNKPMSEYKLWVEGLLIRALRKCDIMWLSYNMIHQLWIMRLIANIVEMDRPSWQYYPIFWRYTFAQYTETKMASGVRPIALLHKINVELNYDAIRVDSERMRLGDPRAAGPRVPDNVWEFPRIVGNSSQRRKFHPTQHPEELMERVILLSCFESDGHGRSVCAHGFRDLCVGSGTSAVVCKRLGVPFTGIELSEVYSRKVAELTSDGWMPYDKWASKEQFGLDNPNI
jgi:DNA modification methylase